MRPMLNGLAGVLLGTAGVQAAGADVRSAAPESVAVTVYRAVDRDGPLSLDALQGFALVTETRRVSLPAGESTLRFEGVAGGIEAQSAIVTGFPEGVIEKNRDARLLSPSTLVAASLHRPVDLVRTNPKTGQAQHTRGTVESDADGGVVFRSAEGVEALRCSGLPETFGFEPFAGAQARPTLSVRVRSDAPITRTVTLSYLAGGFDWSATYTATLAADGKTLDLGAWVTLANGNGESFANAQTQVVAGRLNREAREPEAEDAGGPILAQCWPRGSTSDSVPLPPPAPRFEEIASDAAAPMMMRAMAAPVAMLELPKKVVQEQLGDLKLYRVPDRTTVAARQMKQVRLMDQSDVPVRHVYVLSQRFPQSTSAGSVSWQANLELRTRNTRANHLGVPLPAGSVAVYAAPENLLLADTRLADHAVDEELTLRMGKTADVNATMTDENRAIDGTAPPVPLVPGVALRTVGTLLSRRVEVTNALPHTVEAEIVLYLDDGAQIVRADHPVSQKNGRPAIILQVPAQGRATVRLATAGSHEMLVRPR